MAAHAKYSPSGAHRWMVCHASLAQETGMPNPTTEYALEGTAAHSLLSDCLEQGLDADNFLGQTIKAQLQDDDGNLIDEYREFLVDDEMAGYVQTVIDAVRRDVAAGWTLYVEQKVEFTKTIGTIDKQFGTADIILVSPCGTIVKVLDLKYGAGEQVWASEIIGSDPETGEIIRTGNKQLMSYAAGVLETFDGIIGDFETFIIGIFQPRKDWIDFYEVTRQDVIDHGKAMASASIACAVAADQRAMEGKVHPTMFNPGTKQCRWCKAKATCPALTTMVANEVFGDFEDLDAVVEAAADPKVVPHAKLSTAFSLLPLIVNWCKAVEERVDTLVRSGETVIGPDGLPMKLIEGKQGDRKWQNKEVAEALLVGMLSPDKVYAPREIISPAQAEKLLKKKKTMLLWEQLGDLITRAPGTPKVVLGSNPKPPYVASDVSSEFENLDAEDPTT